MKWSIKIPLTFKNEPMFQIPKHFKFVYHSTNSFVDYYYRWPLNHFVSLYIKLYYWFIIHIYAKIKKGFFSKR
jgi:hypothetical protein